MMNIEKPKEDLSLSALLTEGINTDTFYGSKKYIPTFHSSDKVILRPQNCAKFNKISGPSLTWEVFKKQEEVIKFVSRSKSDLLSFTFQTENGDRRFLAAHPIVFWYYDEQRAIKDRNTYEIIREFESCKLYFDLEYEISRNPNHDGNRMVENFISLVISALKHKYDIEFDTNDVLNLNSSTNSKFSCHLIFQLKNYHFRDNYNVGFFVKQLCHEIRLWMKEGTINEDFQLLSIVNLSHLDIEELEVIDSKGNKKLFCDEAVYSRNRHFRLFKSSKYGKNVPLLESPFNKFLCLASNFEERNEKLFLNSLITWITVKESYYSLEFPPYKLHYSLKVRCQTFTNQAQTVETYQKSSFPEIDQCIVDIVYPGKIYRSVFFKENNIIVYDIIGNRFCENIARSHKNNNVKYIVDLHSLSYYQKCYDPDCANFKSIKKGLPINELFFLNYNIDDELIATAENYCQSMIKEPTSNDLFSSDISDEQLCEILTPCKELFHEHPTQAKDTFLNGSNGVEMVSMLNHTEGNFHPRKSNNKSESSVFPDEIITDRCESELNNFQNCLSEASFLSNEIDNLLVSAAEQCESIYSPPKKRD